MKRKLRFIILAICIMVFTGCTNKTKTEENRQSKIEGIENKDRTINSNDSKDDPNVVFREVSNAELAFDPSLANLYERADFIIK